MMDLYSVDNKIIGKYIYNSEYTKDKYLEGFVSEDTITLNELDSRKNIVSTFTAKLPSEKGNIFKGTMHVNNTNSSQDKLFELTLNNTVWSDHDITESANNSRYGIVSINDDKIMEAAADKFKQYVKENNKAEIAKMIKYPITANVNGKRTTIYTIKQLLSNYDAIFNPEFQKTVQSVIPRFMFVKDASVMYGDGCIWFGVDATTPSKPQIYISAINN